MKYFEKIDFHKIDYVILEIMILLISAGLYCIYKVDMFSTDKNGLFTKQLLGFGLGIVIIAVMLFIDYRIICRLSTFMYLAMLVILAYTAKFGKYLNHVRRWIVIAGVSFQPSELTKVVLIIFLAYLCSLFKNKLKNFYPFFVLAALTVVPMILILLEPHLSPCIVIALLFCVIVLTAGFSYKVLITIFLIFAPLIATIFIGVGVFNWKIPFISSYQVNRIISHLAPDTKEEDSAGKFQQKQSIAAIHAGGSYGKALMKDDSYRVYSNIYANESDFIFAAIGEEYGFIGCCIILFLYFILVIRCLNVAAHAPDLCGKVICAAVSSLFMFQGFVNVGVATNLLPNTGMPFPFISYGLTSLVSSMIAIGLVLNIKVRSKG